VYCLKLDVGKDGEELPLDPSTKELSNAAKGRSVDIDPTGKYAAVGFRDGSVRLYYIGANQW